MCVAASCNPQVCFLNRQRRSLGFGEPKGDSAPSDLSSRNLETSVRTAGQRPRDATPPREPRNLDRTGPARHRKLLSRFRQKATRESCLTRSLCGACGSSDAQPGSCCGIRARVKLWSFPRGRAGRACAAQVAARLPRVFAQTARQTAARSATSVLTSTSRTGKGVLALVVGAAT